MISTEIRKIPYQLASFTNAEIYFIISDLLGLGGLESGLIEEETLYIRPSKTLIGEYLTFVFMSKVPPLSENDQSPSVFLTIGKIDARFNDIHIHSVTIPSLDSDEDIDLSRIDFRSESSYASVRFHAANLIEGILKIISQSDFKDRPMNDLFETEEIFENSHCTYFDLPLLNDVDYCGLYFKIASPYSASGEQATQIYNFFISETNDSGTNPVDKIYNTETLVNSNTFADTIRDMNCYSFN